MYFYVHLVATCCMNFGVDTKKDLEKYKEGNRYNAEVKALLDAGVHKTTEKFEDLSHYPTGCDTYASIHPNPNICNKLAEVDDVVEHFISSLLQMDVHEQRSGYTFDLTGGEPIVSVATIVHRFI